MNRAKDREIIISDVISLVMAAVAAEREACALVCEKWADKYAKYDTDNANARRDECIGNAASIRARSRYELGYHDS